MIFALVSIASSVALHMQGIYMQGMESSVTLPKCNLASCTFGMLAAAPSTKMPWLHAVPQVMMLLHDLFSKYDNLCSQYGVYKVETIGDCYMACCGLLTEDPDHAAHLVQFGQAMLGVAAGVAHPSGGTVRIRVGIHSGRVMSGVVGSIRARYCLFGDTVNTASRMESTGVVDHIQVRLGGRHGLSSGSPQRGCPASIQALSHKHCKGH
jgi:hypothetical protein